MAKLFPHVGLVQLHTFKMICHSRAEILLCVPAPQPLEGVPVSYCKPTDILKPNSTGTYYVLDRYTFLTLMVFTLKESRPTEMSVLSYNRHEVGNREQHHNDIPR